MRLFIAIELDEPFRCALCEVMECMRSQGVTGRYTRRENLHLTLAFIGESSDADAIRRVMDCVPGGAFRIALRGAGRFDDLLWAGVEESLPLTRLADTLCNRLRTAGFSIEKRAFRPHITLVRRAAGGFHIDIPQTVMTVRHITLMKSERIDGRLTYTPVYIRKL